MTITDQIKTSKRNIVQNETQYDLDRKGPEISALSSNNLDKYECLTGEDLGLKPSTVFEYYPLGKICNKGLDKDDKKEGRFKKLEKIKDTNLTHLQAIKDQGEKQLKELKNIGKSKMLKTIEKISKKKMMKEINECPYLGKSIEHLIKQNLFAQKLTEPNMTLTISRFH